MNRKRWHWPGSPAGKINSRAIPSSFFIHPRWVRPRGCLFLRFMPASWVYFPPFRRLFSCHPIMYLSFYSSPDRHAGKLKVPHWKRFQSCFCHWIDIFHLNARSELIDDSVFKILFERFFYVLRVIYCQLLVFNLHLTPLVVVVGDLSPFCESAHVCPEIGYL